ncbi:WD40 repeat [Dillenia turbinata]|uniref:WD40 repeat n=1 Tax=Dillenia turbinata TaxID=194707 RepID=A0AAN8ZMJ8_9MAGN
MSMWKKIGDRETGRLCPNRFENYVRCSRVSSLSLSHSKNIVSAHRGSVNSLQVDLTEGRYLLSGASDTSAVVYDIQQATDYEGSGLVAKHRPLLVALWYPIDTGVFITGSYDHFINVWDTNITQVIVNFKMPGKVYRTAMSSLTMSHMLIAAGTEDVQVRLCDIASGAFAHTLSDGMMTVEWSTSSEWVLMTGGCDGAIRFWTSDVLDAQLGRHPTLLQRATVNKASTLKSSSAGQSSSMKTRAPLRKIANENVSKQLPFPRLLTQVKGYMKQRPHSGLLSCQDSATAHHGAVTGLKVTEDGMCLLSAGSDSRLKLWNVESGFNTVVNFGTVRLQTGKMIQLVTTQDLSLVFVPCMTAVKAFNVLSGKTSMTFRGHHENVNCCWFSSQDQELYTGGNDRQILVWCPSKSFVDEEGKDTRKGQVHSVDEDNWSD